MIETKRLLLREYTWKIIMRKRIILIGIVIITILSVIGFSTYRIKNIRAENYRIAYLYELQNAAFEIYGTYEERCRFQTSEKIELSMLVVDLYAYNYNRSDEQLRLSLEEIIDYLGDEYSSNGKLRVFSRPENVENYIVWFLNYKDKARDFGRGLNAFLQKQGYEFYDDLNYNDVIELLKEYEKDSEYVPPKQDN